VAGVSPVEAAEAAGPVLAGPVLVVNTGSSSLKLTVVGEGAAAPLVSRHVESWDGRDTAPIAAVVAEAGSLGAVGHRVVHGGASLQGPTPVTDEVVGQIEALSPLAPLHQRRALAGIAAARAAVPGEVPQVACFDTAFHATLPAAAATYAVPAEWRARWGLRRYGFHGLSHAYAAGRAAELIDRSGDPKLRVVSCHLGAGASLCAARGGRSVDTTMGFTPLEGLVMATRAGSIDPGMVLWLITDGGMYAEDVRDALEGQSGLTGLAGTPDMAAIVDRAAAGDEPARLAFDVYTRALTHAVAAMVASLGGLDVLVFTGGVGEHAPAVRAAAADRLAHLGIALDPERNKATCDHDRTVSPTGAAVRTLVVEAREDLEIARQVRSVV
jgi:acetate kinase